ncbi:uncharacterized protein LOC122930554 [Bufo gargarizans]|uniref:uncharacterized protein LOC122930554 n=1 Tax=Bufo gargarizans TaxID=30331 RepID=UPI001CF52FED|nr:uncharacterized protein LOC122930554 [Bufo gargarizans]
MKFFMEYAFYNGKRGLQKNSFMMRMSLLMMMFTTTFAELFYDKKSDHDTETSILARRRRGFHLEDFLEEQIQDNSRDISGSLCMGYGVNCCIELHFRHDTHIQLHATAGPKTKFTQLQGTFTHNNRTGTWECTSIDGLYWSIVIKGNESATWSGDLTNDKISFGRVGKSREEIWFQTQNYVKIMDSSIFPIKVDEDWVEKWRFQIIREPVEVNITINFRGTNVINPEVQIAPTLVNIQEGTDPLYLKCNTRLEIPSESVVTWTKGEVFLGSFSNGPTNVIHKGQSGNVKWFDKKFIFYQDHPSSKDSGIYQCCILTINNHKQCETVNVTVWSPTENICTKVKFEPSSPFQINHFQSKSLLRNGKYVTIMWTFNISDWKISSKYPQCEKHLAHMEEGLERWFKKSISKQTRTKRDEVKGEVLQRASILQLPASGGAEQKD